jgi:hypothetical protein
MNWVLLEQWVVEPGNLQGLAEAQPTSGRQFLSGTRDREEGQSRQESGQGRHPDQESHGNLYRRWSPHLPLLFGFGSQESGTRPERGPTRVHPSPPPFTSGGAPASLRTADTRERVVPAPGESAMSLPEKDLRRFHAVWVTCPADRIRDPSSQFRTVPNPPYVDGRRQVAAAMRVWLRSRRSSAPRRSCGGSPLGPGAS